MKKFISSLLVICLLGTLFSGITVSAKEDALSVGWGDYYSQQKLTKFSKGKCASITLSVEEMGTDWYSGGLTIVVNTKLQDMLPSDVWQSTGADGVFTYSFQANASNEMVGTIYRCGKDTGSTAAADWAKASLKGDITIEIKQNDSGVTALYINGYEWVPHESSGLSIPDGYLAIATSAGSEVTVKESRAAADSSVSGGSAGNLANGFGYYSQQKPTKFSKGESASLTISVDELGTDWFATGLTIIVDSKLRKSLSPEVWQTTGADGVFSYSFQANASNEMIGTIYRCGKGTGSTAAADWVKTSIKGDIKIEVKQNNSGVTALYVNGYEWVPHKSSGFSIPDGYIAIATTPGSKVTVKASQEAKKAAAKPTTTTTTSATTTTSTTTTSSDVTTTTTTSSDATTITTMSSDTTATTTTSDVVDPDSSDDTVDAENNTNTNEEPAPQNGVVVIIISLALAVLIVAAVIVVVILKKKRANTDAAD